MFDFSIITSWVHGLLTSLMPLGLAVFIECVIVGGALVLAVIMCGCCAKHNFSPATCTTAATCTKCGETNGSALGHNFSEATCTEAGILEDDKITFYGTYGGLYTYTTVLGDSLTIPSIYVEYLE